MTVLEDVSELLSRRAPNALCDDCIATLVAITPRQHANHKTRELAEQPGFTRRVDVCTQCGRTKKVIYAHSV